MPLTVGHVAALPDLGLLVRTSSASLDRGVRWVAVSEHADPTPWLEGGDLLLTTGMSLDDDPVQARAYVDRLVRAEVAGLGFGVGLSHQHVPASLTAAADRAGLPLLEVPQPVPFVALSKAVSRLLTAEEYAESAAAFDCQRRMIRAALVDLVGDEGPPVPAVPSGGGVVTVLAKHVDGFVLLLRPDGGVVHAHPPTAAGRAVELVGEVDRLRPRGLLASAAVSTAHEHVVLLPVGVKGAAEGFLAVGSPQPLRSADQAVINLAVSLLSWEASRPVAADEGMDPWRRLLVGVAHERGLSTALVADVGLTELDPTRAVAVTWRGVAGRVVPGSLLTAANRTGLAVLCRRSSGDLHGFASVDEAGDLPGALRALVGDPGVQAVGMSCLADLTQPANVGQAAAQADQAATLGTGLVRFADAPSRGLTSLVDAAATRAWATAFLGDLLVSPEGRELTATLRAWLAQHGQVDAAAHELGIHRHTVRHRLRRAEAALGRDLDDPTVRADLWFALGAIGAPESSAR